MLNDIKYRYPNLIGFQSIEPSLGLGNCILTTEFSERLWMYLIQKRYLSRNPRGNSSITAATCWCQRVQTTPTKQIEGRPVNNQIKEGHSINDYLWRKIWHWYEIFMIQWQGSYRKTYQYLFTINKEILFR